MIKNILCTFNWSARRERHERAKKLKKTKIFQYLMKHIILIILLNISDQETLKGSQWKIHVLSK